MNCKKNFPAKGVCCFNDSTKSDMYKTLEKCVIRLALKIYLVKETLQSSQQEELYTLRRPISSIYGSESCRVAREY